MSSTGWLVLAGIALTFAYCGLIWAWRVFADWATAREAARTFEANFIPDSSEVLAAEQAIADAERVVIAEDICNALDEAQAIVDGWSK